MKSILLTLCVFICNFVYSQQDALYDLDYRLSGNETIKFKSARISEGGFQLKMVPNDSISNFKFSIENKDNNAYSITFNKKTLDDYNGYSCMLPEGTYSLKLETKNENFSIQIIQFISLSKKNSRSICGDTDDRVLSNDPKCGRKRVGSICTAQLLSNGLLAMSGHCVADDGIYDMPANSFIEFNVPLSDEDGTLNFSLPEDQYPIDTASIQFEHYASSNCGREWTLFQVKDNAITGLSPFQAQGDFYYVTTSSPSTSQNIQIVGYGNDFDQLERDNVQQIHDGSNNGIDTLSNGGIIISHEADTRKGNSGSAIQRMGNLDYSYGIHNSGGCGGTGCSGDSDNSGISFKYENLKDAINDFYGPNTIHISNVSNSIFETGSAFLPYDTFTEGQNASTSDSQNTVVLMSGDFNVADNYMLTKPMLIISPAAPSLIK